jgi:hypothetical protein
MGLQFSNTAIVEGQFENEAYYYFWRYYFCGCLPVCPEGYKE